MSEKQVKLEENDATTEEEQIDAASENVANDELPPRKTLAELNETFNEDAVLGRWIANKIVIPAQEFDRNFPEQSQFIQDKAQEATDHASKLAEEGKSLGKQALGTIATFAKNRGVDAVAWVATVGILLVRGFYNAIDWMAENMAKPAIKAYKNWEPKTPVTQAIKSTLNTIGNNIASAYKGYNNFWTNNFNKYPKSAYGLAFLSAAQATASITGFHYLHKVEHAISAGHGTLLHFLAVPALIAAGKGSNLLTLKPAIKLGKTTKDGYFSSDLYLNKHKPFYMRRIDPTVQLTKKHLAEWDILVEQNRGKLKERIVTSADNIQSGLSTVFGAISGKTRPTEEASKKLSKTGSTPKAKPFDASKLDSANITDRWEYIIRPPAKEASNTDTPEAAEESTPKPE